MNTVSMDTVVSLCKRRGFIFQSSSPYGGLSSVWDYGPLGVELKNNLKQAWWQDVVYRRSDVEGLDAAILMHPDVWKTSGHISSFADLLRDCKNCKKRFRADQTKGDRCPECRGELTNGRLFNLLFKTQIGSVEENLSDLYLRPETAQGIFVNFANLLVATRKKLPFGIAQIGKAFRNEITTGNFTFRCREFEQMEIEYFVKPGEDEAAFETWKSERFNWYLSLGMRKENLRLREHSKDELAHYAKSCFDIEYQFPFGWSELEGIANRTDYDLKAHARITEAELTYYDEVTKERFYPYVIEPSGGIDRSVLAFLTDAFREEEVRGEKRVVLGLHRDLAPVKVAVLPLLKNRPEVVEMARRIEKDLRGHYKLVYDDTASIGRLYRRQDEIGTLYCITVDVQSLDDKKVTVRDRDSMRQDRVSTDTLKHYIKERLEKEE